VGPGRQRKREGVGTGERDHWPGREVGRVVPSWAMCSRVWRKGRAWGWAAERATLLGYMRAWEGEADGPRPGLLHEWKIRKGGEMARSALLLG